jgi:DNA-binding MarR family transcriptional regulator
MKEKILEVIRQHPGIRQREISSLLGIWVGDLVQPINEMEKEGLIKKELFNDPANIDWHYLWFAR